MTLAAVPYMSFCNNPEAPPSPHGQTKNAISTAWLHKETCELSVLFNKFDDLLDLALPVDFQQMRDSAFSWKKTSVYLAPAQNTVTVKSVAELRTLWSILRSLSHGLGNLCR
jgi:hypothetical protein